MRGMRFTIHLISGCVFLFVNYTGCLDGLSLRNGALTEMFLDFRGPQRLPGDQKDGRKLLLGKKHATLGLMVRQDGGQKRGKFKDPVN